MIKRTHTCGELTKNDVGLSVKINGWISKTRDLGGLIFIDLRDRYGKTQIVFNEEVNKEAFECAKKLGLEDVIGVEGVVINRPDDALNKSMITGYIDVEVKSIIVYNESSPTPFDIGDRNSASEEHRLRYRYLELRTKELQKNIILRSEASLIVRDHLASKNFIEIETPILMKSTPEGARDFLVPSRIHNGKFYALPQSPQTYKQLLMVSGFDRYFQIVKCFRDEDFRADRQPEFTQIDIEMSFVEQQDIIDMGTELTKEIWKKALNVELPNQFPVITYHDAMETYGSDKPDLRFDLPLLDFNQFVKESNFDTFKNILDNGGKIKAIKIINAPNYSRKVIDDLTKWLKEQYSVKGLAWMKCIDGESFDGGISKFFDTDLQKNIITSLEIKKDEMLFIVGDRPKVTLNAMGALRLKLAKIENMIDENSWKPLWVVDFPLFEWNEDNNRWDSLHHPFTSPNLEDINLLDSDPGNVRSLGYDIVMNGYELGGGSIRIYDSDLQAKIFELLGIGKEEANEKFGFLLGAFKYGAPPHGGMAFGFDRIIMLLAGSKQIRDVIAFPKTTSAMSLMDNSPSNADSKQLEELGIKIKNS
ncbi:MAG: aspartate--tRNA ligase [Candidatus Marinimicrobia bacterium]|nr:aspartate--tRNA ligase [Candidatus Neomarinimicrobiota bacterium]